MIPIAIDERSIAERFAMVARTVPHRLAVIAPDARWTYAEAFGAASHAADRLFELGIAPGDRVALLFKQEPSALSALMGAMGTGAIAVPLLADHPAERLRQIITDAGPSALLTSGSHEALARTIVENGTPVVVLDRASPSGRTHWSGSRSDHPAVVMYTSGSTGAPKGVVLTHRQLLQKMALNARLFETTSADRFALFGTYAVGQGMTAILSALLHGAAVCPFDVRATGISRMADWLIDQDISVYMSTLTLFRHLVQSLDAGRRFERVRLVRLGGERVAATDVGAHRRHFAASRLIVSYSSTETGPITARLMGPSDEATGGFVPVGEAVVGVTVVIVDEAGHQVADGEPGEIVVRSEFLSPGYWNDLERTARMFRSVPGAPHLREYRTGDEGRLESGVLHYLGRRESRVKIRGFRVEIEEVELRLRECDGVGQAAVTTVVQPDGALGLVGYVQPAEGAALTAAALRSALSVRLPEHAVPSSFVRLDVLPLTESGKPDRTRLPPPSRDQLIGDSEAVRPRTALEATVATVWRDVLQIDAGVLDRFLSVGGDSLKAGQVAARLSRILGVDVPVGDLLDASTIERTAELVERLRGTGSED